MRLILFALSLCACDVGTGRTCVMDRISYAGSATGAVFVNAQFTGTTGPIGSSIGQRYASVALATAQPPPGTAAGGGLCWTAAYDGHITADETAWIDVGGHYPNGCTPADCAPQPGDPVGHSSVQLSEFQQNYVDIQIRDP